MVRTFQLVTTDGESLGGVELGRPESAPGSIIHRDGEQPNLRVVERVPTEGPETLAFLVVEAVPPADEPA